MPSVSTKQITPERLLLVNSDQGDTFSLGEINGWLRDAGFKHVHTVEAPGLAPLIIVATKPNS